jgi:hypothetical protein
MREAHGEQFGPYDIEFESGSISKKFIA